MAAVLFKSFRCGNTFGVRTIVSKALKEPRDKPAPFPYLDKRFTVLHQQWLDRTTLRLDENSKLIVVEGAHGVGKSKLAQEIAEEYEMLYMPPVDMQRDMYTGPHGLDFKKYNELYPDWHKLMDEKEFFADPHSVAHGAADRMFYRKLYLKYRNQICAIRHILNTGQGVVMEGCLNSDPIYMNAAVNAGFLQGETRALLDTVYDYTIRELLRPNLIVYLDAPVDVVQKKIKDRGNEWDKDSPVWSNTSYLNEIYTNFKQSYLKDMQIFSKVLVYDWSEGGDTEQVCEDIENLEMDLIACYDDQQRDWRFHNEVYAAQARAQFTRKWLIQQKLKCAAPYRLLTSDLLSCNTHDQMIMDHTIKHMRELYHPIGANPDFESVPWTFYLFGYNNYPAFARFQYNQLTKLGHKLSPFEYKHARPLEDFLEKK